MTKKITLLLAKNCLKVFGNDEYLFPGGLLLMVSSFPVLQNEIMKLVYSESQNLDASFRSLKFDKSPKQKKNTILSIKIFVVQKSV